jgi:hypothetical protein
MADDEVLSEGRYEFNSAQNSKISVLARRGRLWGTFAMATGVLGLLGLLVVFFGRGDKLPEDVRLLLLVGGIPAVLAQLFTGMLYRSAGGFLQEVVDTEGDDVELLMHGLRALGRAFRLEAIVAVVGGVLGLAVGLGMA